MSLNAEHITSDARHVIHGGKAYKRGVEYDIKIRMVIVVMMFVAIVSALMLLSHCGEYMANGLTNAVRHEFVMIANVRQTFVAVRKHSRSFLWCFECYAGLTSGECMANVLTNAIRHQFAMIAK